MASFPARATVNSRFRMKRSFSRVSNAHRIADGHHQGPVILDAHRNHDVFASHRLRDEGGRFSEILHPVQVEPFIPELSPPSPCRFPTANISRVESAPHRAAGSSWPLPAELPESGRGSGIVSFHYQLIHPVVSHARSLFCGFGEINSDPKRAAGVLVVLVEESDSKCSTEVPEKSGP